MWNLRDIGSRDVQMPLYWFNNGATPFAIVMITLAIVACTGAVVIARVSDRIAQRRPPGRTG
jgi:hypothetical protein